VGKQGGNIPAILPKTFRVLRSPDTPEEPSSYNLILRHRGKCQYAVDIFLGKAIMGGNRRKKAPDRGIKG